MTVSFVAGFRAAARALCVPALCCALAVLPAAASRAADASPVEAAEVRAFLGQWIAAWRAQDIEAYLALYAADARIDSRDRAQFEQHKRGVFARGERPRIDIGDIVIERDDSTGVRMLRARFDQSYASPTLTDFGEKELLLRPVGDGILIAVETWKPSSGRIDVPLGQEPLVVPAPPGEPVPSETGESPLLPDDETLAPQPLLPPPPAALMGVPGIPPELLENGRRVIEEIVARINGRVLTRSMFLDRVAWYQETLLAEDPPDLEERLKTLAAETLDATIDRWVLLQEAEQHGADIESVWRDWVAAFRRQVGAKDMAELDALLAEQGTTVEKLREQVTETEIPNLYLQQEISGRLTFSESELKEHFEKNRERYQPPAKVTFRQILVPVGEGADPARAESVAKHVIEELAAGRDWCDVNAVYGQQGTGCGELEDIAVTDLLPELREALGGLPLGAVSKPIRSPQGFHVIRVTNRVGAEPVTFEQAREAVLRDLRSGVFDAELQRLVADLRGSAEIEINPRYKLPEEPAAKGSLGQ